MLRHDITGGRKGKKNGIGYACLLPELKEKCAQITEYAAKLGIKTMTENHGYFSQDADRVASLIDAVGNDNFGVLLDLGNFMCADEDPVLSVSRLAPYAVHVHCKDFLYRKGNETNPGATWFGTRGGNYLRGTIIGHGVANIAQSLKILKGKGYDEYISIEFEGVEDNLKGISLGLENVKRFWENA
jgi:sugar phosphate isomerase/epimerase